MDESLLWNQKISSFISDSFNKKIKIEHFDLEERTSHGRNFCSLLYSTPQWKPAGFTNSSFLFTIQFQSPKIKQITEEEGGCCESQ